MHVDTLIQRARSGLGKHTEYKSPGITPPLSASTWPAAGAKIDCSGYMAGVEGGWISRENNSDGFDVDQMHIQFSAKYNFSFSGGGQ